MSLSILADEAVERVVVTALRSNGYDVAVADERYGEGTVDEDLLRDAAERDEVYSPMTGISLLSPSHTATQASCCSPHSHRIRGASSVPSTDY